jgi:lauroyl/myristoyl acyltransferase
VPDRLERTAYRSLPKFRSARRIYEETGLASSGRELDQLVASNAVFTLSYYRRLASLVEPRSRERLLGTIRASGAKYLNDTYRQGRGLILVAPHLGDFDLAVAWISSAVGSSPVVPVANLGRPFAKRAFAFARRACSFDLVEGKAASLSSLSEELRRGGVVILTLDRRAGTRISTAEVFGRDHELPAACLSLARRAEAPLMSAATWSYGHGRILSFGEPLGHGTDSDCESDADLMQRLATDLEKAIRTAPEQWHIPARLDQLSIGPSDSPRSAAHLSYPGRGEERRLRRLP